MATLTPLQAASPLDASDNSYLSFTNDTTQTLSRALDNVDADFATMDTLSWRVEYNVQGREDDTYALGIRIVNGATILAAANSGGTFATVSASVTSTTDVTTGPTAFAYVNTTADKTTWDGASVELQQTFSQVMGPDAGFIRVDFVEFTGTYTAGGGTQSLTGSLFTKAPTFAAGTVDHVGGTQSLTGTTFTKPPSFAGGTIAEPFVTDLGYIDYAGANLEFVSAPDTDLADPGLDTLEAIIGVAFDDYAPTGWAPLITKHNGTGDLGWFWQLRIAGGTNHFLFEWYDSTNARVVQQTSDNFTPAAPGAFRWFRILFDPDDGAGNHTLAYWYSDDPPETAIGSISWTAAGTDTVAGAITSAPDTTAATLLIGTTFTSNQAEAIGKLFAASIRYAGTEVADPDFRTAAQTADAGLTFVDSFGNTWTVDSPNVWVEPAGDALTGTLFTKSPTFPQGAVVGAVALAGTLFTKAPSFGAGTVATSYVLAGTTFTRAPSFAAGAVVSTYALTGVVFTRAPSFGAGTVTPGAVSLAGTTLTVAPSFAQGSLSVDATPLTGTLFTRAPSFGTGALSVGTAPLVGTLFARAPSFGAGVVTAGAVALSGVTLSRSPTFPQGSVAVGPLGLAGTLFARAPSFGAGTLTPGTVTLAGTLFARAPSFGGGAIAQGYLLTGTTLTRAPSFGAGTLTVGAVTLAGVLFARAPSFGTGDVTQPAAPSGVGYIDYGGVNGQYVYATDAHLDGPIGSLELRICVELDNWALTGWVPLITKHEGSAQRVFFFQLRPGAGGNHFLKLEIYNSVNVLVLSETSEDELMTPPTGPRWYRVLYVHNTSTGNFLLGFYYSDDPPETPVLDVTWTFLGTTHSGVAPASYGAYASPTRLLGTTFASNHALAAGKLFAAQVHHTIDNAYPDFRDDSQTSDGGVTFIDPQGTTWHNAYPWEAGSGVSDQELTGTTFTRAPTFGTGVVTGGVITALGITFAQAPSFGVGQIAGGAFLVTGLVFTATPSFGVGELFDDTQRLTGLVFTKAPVFPATTTGGDVGTYSDTYSNTYEGGGGLGSGITGGIPTANGELFVKAPTFFGGLITGGVLPLEGVDPFMVAPSFAIGAITFGPLVPLTGTTFTRTPSFGAGAVARIVIELEASATFTKAPSFGGGAVILAGHLAGQILVVGPSFGAGIVVVVGQLTGVTSFTRAPSFGGGAILAHLDLPDDQGRTNDRGDRGVTTDRGKRGTTTDRGSKGTTRDRGARGYTDRR